MFSFFQWFLFLCARLHKFIRDLRLLRFQAMIANPTPSPTYGLASYFFSYFYQLCLVLPGMDIDELAQIKMEQNSSTQERKLYTFQLSITTQHHIK